MRGRLIDAALAGCKVQLPPPVTGHREPGCYAAALISCGGGMSKEHYLSRGILERMPLIQLVGAKWHEPGEMREYSAGNLTARILCKVHNNALSDLDAEAVALYEALTSAVDPVATAEGAAAGPGEHSVNAEVLDGLRLERWALKVMVGIVVGRIAPAAPVHAEGWLPPLRWLRILFGMDPMPPSWGLFVRTPRGGVERKVARAIEQQTYVDFVTGEPIGADLEVGGFKFRIKMADPDRWDPTPGWAMRRRPSVLFVNTPRVERQLHLGWGDETYDGGFVRITVLAR